MKKVLVSLILISTLPYMKSMAQSEETIVDTTKFVTYRPNVGHRVAQSKYGDLNIRIYTYARYLNQMGLKSTYEDGFGNTKDIDRRQDIQLNKASLYFAGWAFEPKFTYLIFVWTSNTSQGLGAQVAIGGNLAYSFNKHLKLAVGIMSLPGVRTTEGNYPNWLSVDNRMIADEFMRPSYTTGVRLSGELVKKLKYQLMVGNNMSQLGVDAGQFDAGLNTFSGALVYLPTTGEYGSTIGNFGDYENHQKVATRIGAHYTHSKESRQGQPNTDAFENVTLRLSDGTSIFTPNLFIDSSQIEEARDQMISFDLGAKYKGFALEGEYYVRWINDFKANGAAMPIDQLFDNGYQLQASAMVWPKKIQLYAIFSQIFGEYGNPYEIRGGINIFPFKTNYARLNVQYIYDFKCPVGGLSYPYAVGGTGSIFNLDFELNF